MTDRRSAGELRDVADPAWPDIEALVERAPSPVQVLHAVEARRSEALEALQVTSRSYLGALASEVGGLLVDHGWLRVLGAGAAGLPGLHEANELGAGSPPVLEVAWDALGGRFAVNGGGLDAPPGVVCYWGPDTLDWQPIGGGHSAFVAWALSEELASFYASLRWPGWEAEIEPLDPGHGLALWPPPFTEEGRDPATVSRRAVPLTELHGLYADLARQLDQHPDATTFTFRVTE